MPSVSCLTQPVTGRVESVLNAGYCNDACDHGAAWIEPEPVCPDLPPPGCHRAARLEPVPNTTDLPPTRVPDAIAVVEPCATHLVPTVPSSHHLAQPASGCVEVMLHSRNRDSSRSHPTVRMEPVPNAADLPPSICNPDPVYIIKPVYANLVPAGPCYYLIDGQNRLV